MKDILPPRIGAIMALVGIALALSGCGTPYHYEGRWIGHRDLEAMAGEDASILRQLARIELTIKGNGTFELIDSGLPYSGTTREADGSMYLRIEKVLNRPVQQEEAYRKLANSEIILKPKPNGSLAYSDPAGFYDKPVELRREPKP